MGGDGGSGSSDAASSCHAAWGKGLGTSELLQRGGQLAELVKVCNAIGISNDISNDISKAGRRWC